MVEVFVTNIQNNPQADKAKEAILKFYPSLNIGFDLEDIDKVLRVEGKFNPKEIIQILNSKSFKCEIMI